MRLTGQRSVTRSSTARYLLAVLPVLLYMAVILISLDHSGLFGPSLIGYLGLLAIVGSLAAAAVAVVGIVQRSLGPTTPGPRALAALVITSLALGLCGLYLLISNV
jgi:hypothetical protein